MHDQVFLLPEESGCGEVQCGKLLEEERAGHHPTQVSCGSWLDYLWPGEFCRHSGNVNGEVWEPALTV